MAPDGFKWGQEDFFLLIQTLPTFWAERIWILIIFLLICGPQISGFPGPQIFKFLDFQVPRSPESQISKFPDFQVPRFQMPPAAAPPDEFSDPNHSFGTWKSGNLESKRIPNMKTLKIQIRVGTPRMDGSQGCSLALWRPMEKTAKEWHQHMTPNRVNRAHWPTKDNLHFFVFFWLFGACKIQKNIKNQIRSAQNVGKVWISRKKSSWPYLRPSETIFSMGWKNPKIVKILFIFPWWANWPCSPGLAPCKTCPPHLLLHKTSFSWQSSQSILTLQGMVKDPCLKA